MTSTAPTKLIEVALPLDVINREAAREKTIRHGHPATLHLWWARRPLAACRAVLFAQLVDDPSAHPDRFPTEQAQEVERERLFEIIRRLATWEASNDQTVLDEARVEIRRCYPDGPPPIADPFCGGGAIPLEAQRLGLQSLASDLNPVAVLITRALVEVPARLAGRQPVHPDDGSQLAGTRRWSGVEGLAEDVLWYGRWLRDEAERQIGGLYPQATMADGSKATVIAWLWARTVACPNPACRASMPLARSFRLGNKKGREAWASPIVDRPTKTIRFTVASNAPSLDGTVGRAGATCLVCDSPVPLEHIRREGRAGRLGAQLMAVAAEGNRRRVYLAPTEEHIRAAEVERPPEVPDTDLPKQALGFRVQAYGMEQHADLFTNRQLNLMTLLCKLVGRARDLVRLHSDGDEAYADAVSTYLGLAVSKLADLSCQLCAWDPTVECPHHLFTRQAIPMVWDFAESNPFSSSSGSFGVLLEGNVRALLSGGFDFERLQTGSVVASEVSRVDLGGAVVSTDPPYYDNIGYSDLSDFFYVWLRLALRDVHPDIFDTLLTPKSAELVADPFRFDGDRAAAELHFETGFRSFFRKLATSNVDAPAAIYYAFKQSDSDTTDGATAVVSTGWEKMLEGLVGEGLMVVGTWPIRTEASNRMRNKASNALASSIVLVCRPRPAAAGVTDRRGFLQALKSKLARSLHEMQTGGIAPVDLAQAVIGPGMAVFSSYAKVVEPTGGAMSVRTALALINQVLDEVSAEQEGEFDEDTRWAVSWYSEYGHDEGPYGRADDLARAKNVSVPGLVRAGIVKSGAGKVRLLDRDELNHEWDPSTDQRVTVWEVCQHLIRRLDDGAASAAELLARVGGLGDAARDLAYRLFQIAESKKWAKEAGPYNALGAEWPELARLASERPASADTLF